MKNKKKPEILAPAGDLAILKTAVDYGADAVYIGGEFFGMRSSAATFTLERIWQGSNYAHENGAKVYLALNTTPRSREIDQLPDYLSSLKGSGIDALIVGDMGVFSLVRKLWPEMEVHISTQAGIVNYESAAAFHTMGAKRAVLAREMSLSEIEDLRQKVPPEMDLEVFVHGAMCMAFSGRCMFSAYLTGRDANRGQCAQPCRWKYSVVEEKRPGQYFPVEEDESGTYLFNAKDLSLLHRIPDLVNSGVTSFKIEGRAKSAYYVAVITNAYRMALDLYWGNPGEYVLPDWLAEEVLKVSHREYSEGFLEGSPAEGQNTTSSGYERKWEVAAVVEGFEGGRVFCQQRNKIFADETLEVLSPGKKPYSLRVNHLEDEQGNSIESTPHAAMHFSFLAKEPVLVGSMLRQELPLTKRNNT